LYGGIPAIYYGLEQDIADGVDDPHNREALWLYNNYATNGNTYQRIKTLNEIRKKLGTDDKWLRAVGSVLSWTQTDIALDREGAIIVLTNVSRGISQDQTSSDNSGDRAETESGSYLRLASPAERMSSSKSRYLKNLSDCSLLTCEKIEADTDGGITVTWTNGQPFVSFLYLLRETR
jgi:alpha-amylase